jgi:arylsulfatase-like protein
MAAGGWMMTHATARAQPASTPTNFVIILADDQGSYKADFVTSGAYGEGEKRTEHTPPLLFNLAEDPGERHNIAVLHPDVIADLVREVEVHRKTVKPTRPLFDELLK